MALNALTVGFLSDDIEDERSKRTATCVIVVCGGCPDPEQRREPRLWAPMFPSTRTLLERQQTLHMPRVGATAVFIKTFRGSSHRGLVQGEHGGSRDSSRFRRSGHYLLGALVVVAHRWHHSLDRVSSPRSIAAYLTFDTVCLPT